MNYRCATCRWFKHPHLQIDEDGLCLFNPPDHNGFPMVGSLSFCSRWSRDESSFYCDNDAIEWLRVNFPNEYSSYADK